MLRDVSGQLDFEIGIYAAIVSVTLSEHLRPREATTLLAGLEVCSILGLESWPPAAASCKFWLLFKALVPVLHSAVYGSKKGLEKAKMFRQMLTAATPSTAVLFNMLCELFEFNQCYFNSLSSLLCISGDLNCWHQVCAGGLRNLGSEILTFARASWTILKFFFKFFYREIELP
jgi:hypothetical protein